MSARYVMLMAAVPVCYFVGYAYREYHDPDQSISLLNRNPESLTDSMIENRLLLLKNTKESVQQQIQELESHREKLKSTKGRDIDIPGRLW